jgi:hypothetical protein
MAEVGVAAIALCPGHSADSSGIPLNAPFGSAERVSGGNALVEIAFSSHGGHAWFLRLAESKNRDRLFHLNRMGREPLF